MAATTNMFEQLGSLGALEPQASNKEILEKLRESDEEMERLRVAAARAFAKKVSPPLPRYSMEELAAFKDEGWNVVEPRSRSSRATSSGSDSLASEVGAGSDTDEECLVYVAPRALQGDVFERSAATSAPKGRRWRMLRWGAIGVVGVVSVAKVLLGRR